MSAGDGTTPLPATLPDYDAGVMARELGLDPEQVTHLSIVVEARWIAVRWSGYKRVSSEELSTALAASIKATEAKPKTRRRARA